MRLIVIWMSIAAIGAKITARSTPSGPSGLRSRSPEPAEEEAELGEHRDGAGDGGGDGHRQGVAVLDVGELVGDHALELVAVEGAEDAGRRGDGGVLGVAPGGEGVGLVAADQKDPRRRDAGVGGEAADHLVELGGVGAGDGLGAVHAERDLVGVPVGEGVGADGEEQRDHHAAGAADQVADAHEQRRQPCEQHHRLDEVHGRSPPLRRPARVL